MCAVTRAVLVATLLTAGGCSGLRHASVPRCWAAMRGPAGGYAGREWLDLHIAQVAGLPAVMASAAWIPPHATEPGSYQGVALDLISRVMAHDPDEFLEGTPSRAHRRAVGGDAIDFRRRTDFMQWSSLHVVVSPSTGRFEVHVDRFNPNSPVGLLLHWIFDVLPTEKTDGPPRAASGSGRRGCGRPRSALKPWSLHTGVD
jgi:hypothetical protein